MRKKQITITINYWVVVAVAIVAAGAYCALPYFAVYQFRSALKGQDLQQLSGYVDFFALRQNVKEQLKAAMLKSMKEGSDDPGFLAFGPTLAGSLAERMVDASITPEGLAAFIKSGPPGPHEPRPGTHARAAADSKDLDPWEGAHCGFQSLSEFVVHMKNDRGEAVSLTFLRNGLSWRLWNIQLPG